MTDAVKDTQKDIDAIKDDLAALKADLAAMVADIREARGGIAQHLSEEASALYREVADKSTKMTENIGQKVEEQPLTSVLLAFSLGYIISRITR